MTMYTSFHRQKTKLKVTIHTTPKWDALLIPPSLQTMMMPLAKVIGLKDVAMVSGTWTLITDVAKNITKT